jgi:hypothetical protein
MTVNNANSSQASPRPRTTQVSQVMAAFALIPLVTVLAACGGSSSGAPAAQAPNPVPAQAQNRAPGSGGQGATGAFPGASGLIAAASPGTLQVQSTTAQNTVVYTAATTFTNVIAGQVVAGDCVIVTGTPAAGSTQGLTATSARITAKVNGACPTTGNNGAGLPGGGQFSGRPSGVPNGGSGTRRALASATGTVSSVAGSTVLVEGVLRDGPGTAGAANPVTPTAITVTLPASAPVTQTVPATSAAAVVGQCARAIGPANSVGAITAKSITISKPGANGCRTGFGGRFNGNGNGNGNSTNDSGTGNAAGSNA